ncbi:MAG: branched-chain amino acid ABC transporter permease [Firmicutes bacterium]|nr:branched-chain amino acid ABC transporter permease [Bacillota bacterium]
MSGVQAFAQTILEGLLVGSVISLVAMGIALVRGVMDLVNFAQGEFLMIGMYVAYWMNAFRGFDPLVSLPISMIVLFVIGVVIYKLLVRRVLKAPLIAQILLTFGLSIVLTNLALFLWGADYRMVTNAAISGSVNVGGLIVSKVKLVPAATSVVLAVLIYFFLNGTRLGKAVQATAMDREAASLVGIDPELIYSLAFGIAAACAGAAGAALSYYYYIFPGVGSVFNLFAFVAVAMGGFGSIPGAFLGGIVIGLADGISGFYLSTALKYLVVFSIYLGIAIFKPKGLFGW